MDRSYQAENARSRPLPEAKLPWASPVVGWVTTCEPDVTICTFAALPFCLGFFSALLSAPCWDQKIIQETIFLQHEMLSISGKVAGSNHRRHRTPFCGDYLVKSNILTSFSSFSTFALWETVLKTAVNSPPKYKCSPPRPGRPPAPPARGGGECLDGPATTW